MVYELNRYEGRKLCVVFVKIREQVDEGNPDCEIRCLHGHGNVEGGHTLHLEIEGGRGRFTVPRSCYGRILENDGTKMLRDAEFFVMIKVDADIAWDDDELD